MPSSDPRQERSGEPAARAPRMLPQLAYHDIASALEWLTKVFGFRELEEARFVGPDGKVGHAEIEAAPGVTLMLGGDGGHGLSSPKSSGARSQMLCVYVSDVQEHFERSRAAGATICAEPEDKFWGDRTYEAEDLEGHRWAFHQRVRDVSPEERSSPGEASSSE